MIGHKKTRWVKVLWHAEAEGLDTTPMPVRWVRHINIFEIKSLL